MIEDLRKEIDSIDDGIFKLIKDRMLIVDEIGKEKKDSGVEVRVKGREDEVLRRLKENFPDIDPELIEDIMRRLFKESYKLEEEA